jgi:NADPH2:quinone reductase
MKAFVLSPQGARLVEHPPPSLLSNDVLIAVRACALNRVDIAMSRGHVHGSAGGVGNVLGVECAGEVAEVGADVVGVKIGDRVMCSGAGAFAEFAVADFGRVLPVPSTMSYEQAASLPVALQTMHDAVITNGQLKPGQSVLVQGASSGVGLMAMQIAKYMGAGWVAGSSTSTDRRTRLREYGADLAFDSSDPDWVKQVLAATDGKGVDLVIDQVAGNAINQTLQATRIGGRIVNVGRLGGAHADFDFDLHALRRLVFIGVTFRTRSRDEVRDIARKLRADLWDAVTAGKLNLPIDKVFPFDQITSALEHMRANRHFGKIVLRI